MRILPRWLGTPYVREIHGSRWRWFWHEYFVLPFILWRRAARGWAVLLFGGFPCAACCHRLEYARARTGARYCPDCEPRRVFAQTADELEEG